MTEYMASSAGVGRAPGMSRVRGGAKLPQVPGGALVGAVLAPQDRVHGQLGGGGPATEDVADAGVLVAPQPRLGPGLRVVRGGRGELDGVGHAPTAAVSTLVKKPTPSAEGARAARQARLAR